MPVYRDFRQPFWTARRITSTILGVGVMTLWLVVGCCPSLSIAGPFGVFFILAFLLSPFVALTALLLSPPGPFRHIASFVIYSVIGLEVLAACLIGLVVLWIGPRQPDPSDRHFTLSDGSRINLYCLDQGALGGSWAINYISRTGPENLRDRTRTLTWAASPEIKILSNNKAVVSFYDASTEKQRTQDLETFMNEAEQ